MAKIPILDPDNSESLGAALTVASGAATWAASDPAGIVASVIGPVASFIHLTPPQVTGITGIVSLVYTGLRSWKKWRLGRKAKRAATVGAVLLLVGLFMSPSYAQTKTLREAAAEVQVERADTPAPQMVVKQRNWFKRHPRTTKAMIFTGVAVAGAVLCHNTVVGICGHDDRQDSGNSTPPAEPAGGGDDCKKNGCHDNDD